ncbi:MAG TPA: PAS domain-containing protein [Candidatus Saccharimonadales bacterium]|nr:PAS domain-containing protein [Candidatus Saccharimonadales bacterium]
MKQQQKTASLHSYHCVCGKLLFKGLLLDSTVQIKCKKCGELMSFQGRNDQADTEDYYALMLNRNGDVVSASSNILQLFGYKLSDLLSKNYAELLPVVAGTIARANFEPLWSLRNKEHYFFRSKVTHRNKKGEAIAGIAQSKFIEAPNGTFLFNVFYPMEAKVSTRAESEFSHLREYPFILRIGVDGMCLDASSVRQRPYNRPRSEIIGKPFTMFMQESVAVRETFLRQLRTGKPFELLNKKFERVDGSTVRHDTYFAPNFDKNGECVDYSVYVFDYDLLKNHERQFALDPIV